MGKGQDNFSVAVSVLVTKHDGKTGEEKILLNMPSLEWPTNDYMSCVKLQEAIFSGLIEKTVALGYDKFEIMNSD